MKTRVDVLKEVDRLIRILEDSQEECLFRDFSLEESVLDLKGVLLLMKAEAFDDVDPGL